MISFSEIKWNKQSTICHITSYSTSVIFNFSVIPIRWLLTVDSEMASFLFRSLAEDLLVFFSNSCDSRKINCLTKPDGIFVRTSWSTRKPSRAHKRVKHILFGRNSRAIQRMLFIWFIARSVISNMSVLPRPNLKLDLEITNLL